MGSDLKKAARARREFEAALRTAGVNGFLTIKGGEMGGVIYFRRPLDLGPKFTGKDVDQAVKRWAEGGLEKMLKAAYKQLGFEWRGIKITDSYASMGNFGNFKGFATSAEAEYKSFRQGKEVHTGQELAAALEAVAQREGVSVENWVD
jgi:hypothetical protein